MEDRKNSSLAFFSILSPHLELKLYPFKTRTGTPFHKASKVVVTPLYGKVSKAISIFSYKFK